MINHCPWRCDIVIILSNSPPSLISMTDGFYECANALASSLFDVRTKYGVQSEPYEQELCAVPKVLHEQIGQPVIKCQQTSGIGHPETLANLVVCDVGFLLSSPTCYGASFIDRHS